MSTTLGDHRRQPIIRLFISSTFNDLKQERDALQKEVFPHLEEFCQKNGFQFQAIDLRWGVSGEAGLHHRAMQICFEELRRSQDVSPKPNFLILLGNRYGWRPLPEAISSSEYNCLVAAAAALEDQIAALPQPTDDRQPPESAVVAEKIAWLLKHPLQGKQASQVLQDWYRFDQNVLVADPGLTDPDREQLNVLLQPRTQDLRDGLDYTRTKHVPPKDRPEWKAVQEVLWAIINAVFAPDPPNLKFGRFSGRFRNVDWQQHINDIHGPKNPKRAVPQIVRFQGSATEQEIWYGALGARDAPEHVFAFFRDIDPNQDVKTADILRDFFDGQADPNHPAIPEEVPALSALKQQLRDRLGANAVQLDAVKLIPVTDAQGRPTATVTEGHLNQLCDGVRSKLTGVIQAEIVKYRDPTKPGAAVNASAGDIAMSTERELQIERDEHQRFARERGSPNDFVGRGQLLTDISAYLSDGSRAPFVIHGPSGSGKSALLARASQDIPESKGAIVRFIGTTPASSDLRKLLANLCQELRLRYPLPDPLSSELRLLIEEFRNQLALASEQQPVILFLDALDQLADVDNALRLYWIPFGDLPPHVKLVVSCLSDRDTEDPAGLPYVALNGRKIPAENMRSLEPLSPAEAHKLLFEKWLPAVRRKVDDASGQRALIMRHLNLESAGPDAASAPYRQPLYLKLLFEEIRHWHSYDTGLSLPQNVPPQTHIEALLQHFIRRLRQPENHGELLVTRALGYLAAARRGLRETELLELLFQDEEFRQHLESQRKATGHQIPSEPPRIPIAIWSRLRFEMAPYLTERAAPGGTVLTFYHRQVAEWVKSAFLESAEWHRKPEPLSAQFSPSEAHPHARLARYFQGQGYFLDTLEEQQKRAKQLPPTPRKVKIRVVDELPFQLLAVARRFGEGDPQSPHWDSIADLFMDIHFLEAKAEAAE